MPPFIVHMLVSILYVSCTQQQSIVCIVEVLCKACMDCIVSGCGVMPEQLELDASTGGGGGQRQEQGGQKGEKELHSIQTCHLGSWPQAASIWSV